MDCTGTMELNERCVPESEVGENEKGWISGNFVKKTDNHKVERQERCNSCQYHPQQLYGSCVNKRGGYETCSHNIL
jgi:hypothetical protein